MPDTKVDPKAEAQRAFEEKERFAREQEALQQNKAHDTPGRPSPQTTAEAAAIALPLAMVGSLLNRAENAPAEEEDKKYIAIHNDLEKKWKASEAYTNLTEGERLNYLYGNVDDPSQPTLDQHAREQYEKEMSKTRRGRWRLESYHRNPSFGHLRDSIDAHADARWNHALNLELAELPQAEQEKLTRKKGLLRFAGEKTWAEMKIDEKQTALGRAGRTDLEAKRAALKGKVAEAEIQRFQQRYPAKATSQHYQKRLQRLRGEFSLAQARVEKSQELRSLLKNRSFGQFFRRWSTPIKIGPLPSMPDTHIINALNNNVARGKNDLKRLKKTKNYFEGIKRGLTTLRLLFIGFGVVGFLLFLACIITALSSAGIGGFNILSSSPIAAPPILIASACKNPINPQNSIKYVEQKFPLEYQNGLSIQKLDDSQKDITQDNDPVLVTTSGEVWNAFCLAYGRYYPNYNPGDKNFFSTFIKGLSNGKKLLETNVYFYSKAPSCTVLVQPNPGRSDWTMIINNPDKCTSQDQLTFLIIKNLALIFTQTNKSTFNNFVISVYNTQGQSLLLPTYNCKYYAQSADTTYSNQQQCFADAVGEYFVYPNYTNVSP